MKHTNKDESDLRANVANSANKQKQVIIKNNHMISELVISYNTLHYIGMLMHANCRKQIKTNITNLWFKK